MIFRGLPGYLRVRGVGITVLQREDNFFSLYEVNMKSINDTSLYEVKSELNNKQ
jgi:hypothetical protein